MSGPEEAAMGSYISIVKSSLRAAGQTGAMAAMGET